MRPRIYVVLTCSALLIALAAWRVHSAYREAALVGSWPNEILGDPRLLQLARERGPAVYREHCASCHGVHREGNRTQGAPNLTDNVWLYGNGSITDIESTVLYGIRSGHPKAHHLTDMPAFGRTGQLTNQDIHDVVEYVLSLSQQPHEDVAAQRGRNIFTGAGLCYDCHGEDAYGVSDYGTPPLTGRSGSWLYGGDRATLYKSVYDGRQGLCPAWIGKLSFVEIRALSVYLYEAYRGD